MGSRSRKSEEFCIYEDIESLITNLATRDISLLFLVRTASLVFKSRSYVFTNNPQTCAANPRRSPYPHIQTNQQVTTRKFWCKYLKFEWIKLHHTSTEKKHKFCSFIILRNFTPEKPIGSLLFHFSFLHLFFLVFLNQFFLFLLGENVFSFQSGS